MFEVIFLFVLALIWIVFATIQDSRQREVANWLNFSLIIFALGFRFFYSLFSLEDFQFFYQGLIGLGIFFVIGNVLYYGKMFAGGDAKLMIALGPILPFSTDFLTNIKAFLLFFILFLFVGAFYSIGASLYLSLKNFRKFRKEIVMQFHKNKTPMTVVIFLALFFLVVGLSQKTFFVLGIFVFVLPYLYIYIKAVDESCMVVKVSSRKLTEGDWLYSDLRLGKKLIKANWGGLTKSEISLIRKKKKFVTIRNGIPFTPVFLVSFLLFYFFMKNGLWNSFW